MLAEGAGPINFQVFLGMFGDKISGKLKQTSCVKQSLIYYVITHQSSGFFALPLNCVISIQLFVMIRSGVNAFFGFILSGNFQFSSKRAFIFSSLNSFFINLSIGVKKSDKEIEEMLDDAPAQLNFTGLLTMMGNKMKGFHKTKNPRCNMIQSLLTIFIKMLVYTACVFFACVIFKIKIQTKLIACQKINLLCLF